MESEQISLDIPKAFKSKKLLRLLTKAETTEWPEE